MNYIHINFIFSLKCLIKKIINRVNCKYYILRPRIFSFLATECHFSLSVNKKFHANYDGYRAQWTNLSRFTHVSRAWDHPLISYPVFFCRVPYTRDVPTCRIVKHCGVNYNVLSLISRDDKWLSAFSKWTSRQCWVAIRVSDRNFTLFYNLRERFWFSYTHIRRRRKCNTHFSLGERVSISFFFRLCSK